MPGRNRMREPLIGLRHVFRQSKNGKENKRDCGNNRGIRLVSIQRNLFGRVVTDFFKRLGSKWNTTRCLSLHVTPASHPSHSGASGVVCIRLLPVTFTSCEQLRGPGVS